MSASNTAITPLMEEVILKLTVAVERKCSMLPILRAYPIATWDELTAQTVLGNVLTIAHTVHNTGAITEIADYYNTLRSDPLPVKLWIQTANLAPNVALWCRAALNTSEMELWRMLLNLTDDELAVCVADHLHAHLPLTQVEDWHQLIAMMEHSAELAGADGVPVPHHNQGLRWWLIRNQPLQDYPDTFPSVAKYTTAISRFFSEGRTMPVMTDSEHGPQTTEQVIKQMITMYAGSRYLMRGKMAAVVFGKQVKEWPSYNDTPVHQRYGPVNALTTEHADISDKPKHTICTRYGGCRMLSCQEFEIPDEDGSQEWFTGQCVQCQKTIEHKEEAVRIPQLHGGWRGCLCDWYCVSEYIANSGYNNHDREMLEQLCERFSIQLDYTPVV